MRSAPAPPAVPMGSKAGSGRLVFASSVLWSLGPTPGSPADAPQNWVEAPEDETLEPGDLGGGTDDLDSGTWYSPRRVRRVPISFSAVVLLLTLTVGMGMSAGLLAGPSAWDPFAHSGHGVGTNGTNGSIGPIGTPGRGSLSPNTTNPSHSTNNSTGTHPPTGNSTGNTSGHNGSTTGNRSGSHGNSTGNSTGNTTGHTGNTTGNGTGTRTGPTNTTKPPPKAPPTRPTIIYRNQLPWFPTDSRFYLLIGAALGLGGLAVAVLIESLRPPADRGNPWRGQGSVARRRLPRRMPLISPKRALEDAVRSLRAELVRYHRAGPAAVDADVRERIVQLYGALLTAVGPGLGSVDQRTPREVEWLSVRYLGVGPDTAHALTEMFEEARYSTHRLRPEVVGRAERALAALVDDLDRRRWEL